MIGRVYQRKCNGNWCIDYCASGQRVREVVGPSKKLAEAVLHKRLTEIAENRHLDVKKDPKIKFADFAQRYIKDHLEANKRSGNSHWISLRSLLPFFGGKYLGGITVPMIEEYKRMRSEKVQVSTVNRDLALLRAMFNKAIAWGIAYSNPMKNVQFYKENNQRLRYLDAEEIDRLLNNCSSTLRAIVIMAIHTGMRKGELQGLKWSDINYQESFITLRHTKNGEIRYVPMNKVVKETVLSVRKHPESSYVFCGEDGNPFNFRKSFETALKKSGIRDFRFHDLRHTFASQMRMSGVDLHTIGELLGHKSLQMTKRYAHLSPDAKIRAVEVLSEKFGTPLAHRPKVSEPEIFYGSVSVIELDTYDVWARSSVG